MVIFKHPTDGEWFCSQACEENHYIKFKKDSKGTKCKKTMDNIQQYSIAVLGAGLNLLCIHDAERENDGPALVSYWKSDLIPFFKRNHYKYMILSHRLVAGT